jgi:hypothetical protein
LFQLDEWLIHHWSHNTWSLPFFFNTQAGRREAELIPTAREKRRAWMDREQSDRAIGILSRLPAFRKESLEENADSASGRLPTGFRMGPGGGGETLFLPPP